MDNIRLLLVDDEISFISTISKRLEKRGYSPQIATSGEDCLALLETQPMDVVVSDVKMPGMSGIDVLQAIKKDWPDTEVILLTGHASSSDGVEGIKAGAFDYLVKPIEFEQLLRKILQAFHKIERIKGQRQEMAFREQMEQQMVVAERLASIGTLASGVAHEINNPLAIINESVGLMQMLMKKEEFADMPRREIFEMALGKIEGAIDRARRITHQLLGVVRKSDAVLTEVDLDDLAAESIGLVQRQAIDKNIELIREIDPQAAKIWSDPNPLRQVLINLLTNAIHATDSPGKVHIIIQSRDDHIEMTIRDTGSGIPAENMDHIFEPFFTTKAPGEGTGLGLFVTRGLIEKLGGTIDVESKVGQGSDFRIVLPRRHVTPDVPLSDVPPAENVSDTVRTSFIDRIKNTFAGKHKETHQHD